MQYWAYKSRAKTRAESRNYIGAAFFMGKALELMAAAVPLAFVLACVSVAMLRLAAPHLRLLDAPDARKTHVGAVPLVGGLGIFASLLITSSALGFQPAAAWFIFALALVVAVGLWDDILEISPRIRFVIQIVAAAIMIWGAGVVLRHMGDLFGFGPFGTAWLAIPITIFAIVGVVNAVNMMDGMDGLSGSVGVVAFAWYAAVAYFSDLAMIFAIAIMFCGALGGFLVFNLRFPWQPRAKVFMGDAGSLMMGFALGWFAVDLTQGPGRSFPAIAALWVLLLLADCVSIMARRIRQGRSPFSADRHHIHHYLQARGFTHSQTLAILVALTTAFGAVGFFGWALHVPEPVLFWAFFFGFFAYHFWIQREWKRLERAAAGVASELPADAKEPQTAAAN
jgi:UDP-GlcNAc:undecaprenyl-phosphate/decaprenyl-phosphate GlcNAc-1-phosphate transferase